MNRVNCDRSTMYKIVYLICFLAVLISNISFFPYVQPTYVGWLFNIAFILSLCFLFPNTYGYSNKPEIAYIIVMVVGFLLHLIFTIDNRVFDTSKWILPIILLIAGRKCSYQKAVFYSLMLFFFVHCCIAINEYLTNQYFVNFLYTEEFADYYERNSQFRAFGLMAHPLYAANVVLIVMSFLLVSNGVNKYIKVFSILLGSFSLVCFNSRAAMMIWAALLLYRLFLYNRRPIVPIFLGIVIYLLFISDLFVFLEGSTGLLGRLGESGGLRDDSSLTRLLSFAIFANQRWDFNDVVAGGRVFYLPGTQVSLENGLLLTIAWWGWIVGILKVVLEIVISWKCLKGYDRKDRVIVIIATWVCAYSNNNTINTFVFAFFIISFIAIRYYSKNLEGKNIEKEYNNYTYNE